MTLEVSNSRGLEIKALGMHLRYHGVKCHGYELFYSNELFCFKNISSSVENELIEDEKNASFLEYQLSLNIL